MLKELKWGVLFSGAILVWLLIERLTGLHDEHIEYHAYFTNLFAVVAVVIYVLALRDKRASLPNQEMRWIEGFLSGVIIAVVVAALSPLLQIIAHYLISPDFFANMQAYTINEGLMEPAAAREYFSLESYIIQSVIGALLMGAATAAVVAFFLRTRDRDTSRHKT
ncbi:DUF4199 domain-containing protein [Pseudidiomarina terrestris]|uniref:DUF4199 domain-containing protein n=1 Tax=Pseudidiomarina terrestris TaxID=2820060 RepID=A0AAW7QX49_9GAMM|nr:MULTISPECIES: DUF4199 domain-containing protein [unclassified Pseudidiomarina]MDN7124011.1 DUF4199 domain-containing protein [Pseudidiomarina sp. 1APP75-32.1]MDN7127075.1 DUF4199 domain-containing protein [Pseudidiomarina sp. 1APR75-33.1]MDN7128268.1 DUF4199 domain-containing protein [Pseudidiomarina sp. 1APR75-15]MDN7135508.1 DUF4199 domain-containing protein [Pseudidiomarina sp. 1ASP75-5]MDN7138995.1 DUF4199 domain-containing protein [Pseudidiomarina sp. 1ASP75-14]